MVKRLLFILLVIIHSLSLASETRPLTSLQTLDYQLFRSALIQHNYHLYIKVPETIEEGKLYPTIYLLDGGITFPLLAAYAQYLELAGDMPPAIIVGISYGTTDWRKGNRRSVDFTAPSKEREFWGGAEKFSQMLATELIPHVEKNYPSDATRRILFGQSIGGQFVLFSAMFKPDQFWGHIASNPALHRNLAFYTNTAVKGKTAPLLFISRSSKDEQRFIKPMNEWVNHWQNERKPFVLNIKWVENHNHFSVAPESFRNGLMWLFGRH